MCSIFLDTQFPGAREVIDPDGLLGEADIARRPSIHPRASELEFLKDLRALEVYPDEAPTRHETPLGRESADTAQHAQQAPAEETRLTADVLRMLSLQPVHETSQDAVKGGVPSPSRRGLPQPQGEAVEGPPSPGTPPKKRKARHSSGLVPKPEQPSRMRTGTADVGVLTDDSDEDDSNEEVQMDLDGDRPEQRASSEDGAASQQASLRPPPWKAKRRRTWRSEDSDPSWQPADEPHSMSPAEGAAGLAKGATGVTKGTAGLAAGAARALQGSVAVTAPAASRRGPQYAALAAPAHISRSKYKGVSCHKCAFPCTPPQ